MVSIVMMATFTLILLGSSYIYLISISFYVAKYCPRSVAFSSTYPVMLCSAERLAAISKEYLNVFPSSAITFPAKESCKLVPRQRASHSTLWDSAAKTHAGMYRAKELYFLIKEFIELFKAFICYRFNITPHLSTAEKDVHGNDQHIRESIFLCLVYSRLQ